MKQLGRYKDRSWRPSAKTDLFSPPPAASSTHFGLQKIKKRVIEYPAVVRLKELNAEREIAEEQKRVESIALEEASKAEAKPVTPTERLSRAMSLFRSTRTSDRSNNSRIKLSLLNYRRSYPPVSVLSTIECLVSSYFCDEHLLVLLGLERLHLANLLLKLSDGHSNGSH